MCIELSLYGACRHSSRRQINCVRTWRYKTRCCFPFITALFGDGPDKPCEEIGLQLTRPGPCPRCSNPLPGFEPAPERVRDRRPRPPLPPGPPRAPPHRDHGRSKSHRPQQPSRGQARLNKPLPPTPMDIQNSKVPILLDLGHRNPYLPHDSPAPNPARQHQRKVTIEHGAQRAARPQPPVHKTRSDRGGPTGYKDAARPLRPRKTPKPPSGTRSQGPTKHTRVECIRPKGRPKESGDELRIDTAAANRLATRNKVPVTTPSVAPKKSAGMRLPGRFAQLYRLGGGGGSSSDESFACMESRQVERRGWANIELGRQA